MSVTKKFLPREPEGSALKPRSLQPHGLYSPWNSPGQNPGVGSSSFLQGSSQTGD